jgi:hypothetical protein
VVTLKDERTKKAHEASAQLACEAAGAIRTVASLTREKNCTDMYSQSLEAPHRDSDRVALFSNVRLVSRQTTDVSADRCVLQFWFSITQALSFWVIALIFCLSCCSPLDVAFANYLETGYGSHQVSVLFLSDHFLLTNILCSWWNEACLQPTFSSPLSPLYSVRSRSV